MTTQVDKDDVFAALDRLVGSEEYNQLLVIAPEFELFDALGTTVMENASSRALAYLLDSSNTHGLGITFLQALLREIHRDGYMDERYKVSAHRLSLEDLLAMWGVKTEVAVEWMTRDAKRVDILVRILDANDDHVAVVGIENKHWAIDQEGQVSDYQSEIAARFPDKGVVKRLLYRAQPLTHGHLLAMLAA